MSTPLDELANRAAVAIDRAAQQRADGPSFVELHRRRRARQRRRGAAGTALVLVLVMVTVTAVGTRPGLDRTTLLERPSATEVPLPVPGVEGAEPPAAGAGAQDDVLSSENDPSATSRDEPGDSAAATARDAGWHALPAAPLRAAFGASAVWTGDEFVVWGGYAGGGTADEEAVADAAAYDPAADRWRELPDAPIPGAYDGEAIWTGDEVWVLGRFGGEAGREAMRGTAAYDPVTDQWRVLPELPEPMVAAAWLDGAAAVLTADGALWTLGADDEAWVQATSPTFDPPFTATGGDGALLVAANRLHTLTAVDGDSVHDDLTEELLGLSGTAQDQRIGVAATMVDDGDPSIDTSSTVVVGETGTRVSTLGTSLHWRMEGPPTARFLDGVHMADDRRVVAVDSAASGLELLDVAAGGWERLALPPHAPGHSSAIAAGGGMVFTWGGASSSNLPREQGALLVLPPASPRTWPPGRGADVIASFTAEPMPLGLPDYLDPDPGMLPPIITPPAAWALRGTADGTPVLVQHTNDPAQSRSIPISGPPLRALAWGDLVWAAGPSADGGVRVVQASWQEVVPHIGTITVPFRPDPDGALRIAPVAGGAWISGLLDDEGEPLIIRVDQATGDVTAQTSTDGTVFPASGPGEALLLDDTTLTRADADDLTPIGAAHPLPEELSHPTQVWDDRGTTTLLGEDAAGAVLVWTVGDTAVREPQLTEPVVAADAQPFDGAIALATAAGQVEVIDLADPGPGQLVDAGYDAAVRHIRMHSSGRRVDVIYSDGHTSTHSVRSG